jgi:hypothetical protein
MNDVEIVKRELARRVEELAVYLFPNGKREGNHWCVGDISGAPGNSFKICLTGDKAGLWGDFADSQRHSCSLLDLWMRARNVDFKAALREAGEWTGQSLNGLNGIAATTRIPPIGRRKDSSKPFDWQAWAGAFTDIHIERLAQWRGYSIDFCSWLKDNGLVGLYDGCIAFSVHDRTGKVVAVHYRLKDGSWRYCPQGAKAHPFVIGELIVGEPVHVFESQWDAFAFLDVSGERSGVIVTRGASNGALVSGLIRECSTAYVWTQNDEAGEKWQKDICANSNAPVKRLKIPASHKDLNDWTRAGATAGNLFAAITSAQAPFPMSIKAESVRATFHAESYPQSMDAEAFHGLAGEIVRRIEPHTEADPAALLFQLLAAFGSVIGRDAYMVADGARHYLNLFGVLVGQSSKGRKGTSWNQIANLLERIDADWRGNRVTSGMSSGEGLIWNVRDPITVTKPFKDKPDEYEEIITDAGIADKRLFVIEGEFAKTLKVMERETNTLSPVIRQAWESGSLKTLIKNSPAKATGAHISIVGHITRDELRRLLNQTETANGFANRFNWLAVKRSKCLPEGGQIDTVNFNDVVMKLASAIEFARKAGELKRSESARELWRATYPELSEGKPGMLGAVTARAEAQVLRLSALYALLDNSVLVEPVHHYAAMALWDYCEQSARWIFGTRMGDKNADRILFALQQAGSVGMTKTEISEQVFNRNLSSDALGDALMLLHQSGVASFTKEVTGGAPCERWQAGSERTNLTK